MNFTSFPFFDNLLFGPMLVWPSSSDNIDEVKVALLLLTPPQDMHHCLIVNTYTM